MDEDEEAQPAESPKIVEDIGDQDGNEETYEEDPYQDDFGKIKMDVFKQQCRNILGLAPYEVGPAERAAQME